MNFKMNFEIPKPCVGCTSAIIYFEGEEYPGCDCLEKFPEFTCDCPCSSCLIKPMCIDPCKEFKDFTHFIVARLEEFDDVTEPKQTV